MNIDWKMLSFGLYFLGAFVTMQHCEMTFLLKKRRRPGCLVQLVTSLGWPLVAILAVIQSTWRVIAGFLPRRGD